MMNRLFALGRRAAAPLPKVGATPSDAVFAENKWRLLRSRPRPEGLAFQTPVLLVPSLINRHYVLDLMPGKSLTAYLVEQGHDVYTVDWGKPTGEDRYLSFDDFADRYLARALRVTTRIAGSPQAHLFGYCLGGTLAVIQAALHGERVASLLALGAPIRFHDDGLLSAWGRCEAFDTDAMVDALGNVPWPLMQASFHMLRPTLNLSKLVQLFHKAEDPAYLDGFLALETWGNDNVPFPGRAFREYITSLYREDGLVANTLRVSGQPVRLENIRCPTLAVTFEHDNIVPWQSAAVLLERVGSEVREHLHLPGGHVGTLVSSAARTTLWPKLSKFWAEHELKHELTVRRPSRGKASAPVPSPFPSKGASRSTGN
jgi:polyhydroxyalkanoate synthase